MKILLSQLVINWSGLCHFAMAASFTKAALVVWLSPLSGLSTCSFFQEFYILGTQLRNYWGKHCFHTGCFLFLVLAHSVPPSLSDKMRMLMTLEMTNKFTWFAKLEMKCLLMREWWWFFSASLTLVLLCTHSASPLSYVAELLQSLDEWCWISTYMTAEALCLCVPQTSASLEVTRWF